MSSHIVTKPTCLKGGRHVVIMDKKKRIIKNGISDESYAAQQKEKAASPVITLETDAEPVEAADATMDIDSGSGDESKSFDAEDLLTDMQEELVTVFADKCEQWLETFGPELLGVEITKKVAAQRRANGAQPQKKKAKK